MFAKYKALYEKSAANLVGEPGGAGEYACVKNLLMSIAVDIILRSKLKEVHVLSGRMPEVRSDTTPAPRPEVTFHRHLATAALQPAGSVANR